MPSAEIILVPIDYEVASMNALAIARNFAGRLGLKIQLLHVYSVPVAAYPGLDPLVAPGLPGEIAEIAKKTLEKFAKDQGGLEAITREGDAATEILRAIEELKPALVAMGTHGRSGFAHMIVGSVAEKVVRGSMTPVLTVHAPPA